LPEETINNYKHRFKQFLSLLGSGPLRRQTSHGRARSAPRTSITRLQSGMPQAQRAPTRVHSVRSRYRPHTGYVRGSGSYVTRPHRAASIAPRMFRIG
jgi:hypothetical protein